MLDFPYCKLEIFLPPSHLEAVQAALRQADAGHSFKNKVRIWRIYCYKIF